MTASEVQPTGLERRFPDDDIIVSKTDTKGIITYVNDVFLDVSGYAEDQLLGRPHNVIRHPAMPRSVFELLWRTISDGREIFAYVINMTATGDHYWVFAHVTPTFDATGRIVGYHSNRRAVDREVVRQVSKVYEQVLAVEQRFTSKAEQIAAGLDRINSLVEPVGGYDPWVWSLTSEEDAR